jgi:hypothetical protein
MSEPAWTPERIAELRQLAKDATLFSIRYDPRGFVLSLLDELERVTCERDEWVEAWQEKFNRVRRILSISAPPERTHPLSEGIVQCPLCGTQRLGNATVDAGDDDSVSVDEVVGILSDAERYPYIVFSRDDWGVARAGPRLWLTETEAESHVSLLRQISTGWIVPESEAKVQR